MSGENEAKNEPSKKTEIQSSFTACNMLFYLGVQKIGVSRNVTKLSRFSCLILLNEVVIITHHCNHGYLVTYVMLIITHKPLNGPL